ncbi:MAG TPA: hypothetical protein VF605_14775 [Allosphingosinicella sp.]|jgi:hypothetical protein
MTTSRSEELLVGFIALGVVPWAIWTIRRGLQRGMLPIGRSYVRRDERAGAFGALLAFYAGAACAMAFIALDLLFGIRAGLG